MEKKIKTINGKPVEYIDAVHNRTTTKVSIWDRIKILLGKPLVTELTIYTQNERVIVVGTETVSYVPALVPYKPKGGMQQMA